MQKLESMFFVVPSRHKRVHALHNRTVDNGYIRLLKKKTVLLLRHHTFSHLHTECTDLYLRKNRSTRNISLQAI